MEISIDDIESREEPYQIFLDSIVGSETKRRYVNNLHNFLKLIPKEIYKKHLGKIPENQEKKTLVHMFLDLAKKNPDVATNIIVAYMKQKRKEVLEGKISSH
ncbi:MAG: site-specific integrase, partial [Nitrosopumilaceae archaeon]